MLFPLGVYAGHQLWGDDPQPTVVTLDIDPTPTPGTLSHAGDDLTGGDRSQ